MSRDAASRFWKKVAKTDLCWDWTGAKNPKGYGRFSVDGRLQYPHRWIYEATKTAIPDGWVVDHLCRNPSCVRPDHLEAIPQGLNTSRGLLGFGLTGRCRAGRHDMTNPNNVYLRPDGGRRCRHCHDSKGRSAA